MKVVLRHGDCVSQMSGMPEGSVGAVVCDPPYGLEFDTDKMWVVQGGFTRGGSRRFQNSPPLPSYGSSSENRICRTCGGSERGRDRVGFIRCRCVDPKFPDRKVKPGDLGRMVQRSHTPWLAESYRVLIPGGTVTIFSGTRVFHRLVAAVCEAGFVNVNLNGWSYGSGFPKSTSLSEVGWIGWGTALKPAWEPFIVGKKPG